MEAGIREYLGHSQGQESAELKAIKAQITKVTKELQDKIISQPIVLQKTEIECIEKFQQMAKRFGVSCSSLTQKEIAKFNKDEAKKMQQEMEQMKKEMKLQNDKMFSQLQATLSELEKERLRAAKEREAEKERKLKRAYNPRFANKNCWSCG